MPKVVLNTITSGYGSTAALNDNFDTIEEAFDNTLSRDGTTPNEMNSLLNMNNNQIINLGAPSGATHAARLQDIVDGAAEDGALTAELRIELGSTATGEGASLIGIEDAGGLFAGTTVESALQQVVGPSGLAVLKSTINAKGDLIVGTADDTPARKAAGADGQILSAQSSQADGLVWTDYTVPNLLVNGDWRIDQINEGALYSVATAPVAIVDGSVATATGGGTFTVRAVADPDNASRRALEVACTVADGAIAAGDLYSIYWPVEGYDAAVLQAGLASAQPVTILFGFKTNVTGVYGVGISNGLTRHYVAIITVVDTAEHDYSFTVPMDTSGTWDYTTDKGLQINLILAAGSTYQGTAGVWVGPVDYTTSAQVNFMSSTSNIAYIKRVRAFPGAIVRAYGAIDPVKELLRCQRYYAKSFNQGTAVGQNLGTNKGENYFPAYRAGALQMYHNVKLPATMRSTAPTVTTYNTNGTNVQARDIDATVDCSNTTWNVRNESNILFTATGNAATAVGNRLGFQWTANARFS